MFDPRNWRKRDLIDAMRNVAPTCLPANPSRQSVRDIRIASYAAVALKGAQFVEECLRLSGPVP